MIRISLSGHCYSETRRGVCAPYEQMVCGWFMFVCVLMSRSVRAHCCFHWMNVNAAHLLLSHMYSQNIGTFFFSHWKKKKKERRSAINEHPKYQQLPRCPLTQPLRIKPCLSNRLSPLQRAAFAVKRFFIKRGLPRALGWWLRVISQLGVWATGSGPVQGHPHLHKNRQEVLKKGSWWVFGRLDMKIQQRKWLIMSQQPERL